MEKLFLALEKIAAKVDENTGECMMILMTGKTKMCDFPCRLLADAHILPIGYIKKSPETIDVSGLFGKCG